MHPTGQDCYSNSFVNSLTKAAETAKNISGMETQNKIEELTRKIHREGLEKAQKEAEIILAEARKEAGRIREDALSEAEKIRSGAKVAAEKHHRLMEAELRTSVQRTLAGLKKEITELIQAEVIKKPLAENMNSKELMNRLLETTIRNWNACSDDHDLKVLVPQDHLESAEEHLKKSMLEVMNNGLVLKADPAVKSGFEIHPANGHYKISMSDEAFETLIREHFRPRTVEFLFGKQR
jgi:V/A-type H+-transporting ATPase subunit E